MVITTQDEVVSLVNHLKNKIVIATAMVMIKSAKKEGTPAAQYARNFQEKYIRENQDKVDPILEQRFLSQCQDEVLKKLRKAIPVPDHSINIKQDTEDFTLIRGGSTDWFDDESPAPEVRKTKQNVHPSPLNKTHKTVFTSEDCVLKNIEFVESITTISDESQRKEPIPTSVLHSLLYNEEEFMSQAHYGNKSVVFKNDQFSDDSGIGCSEKLSEQSCSVNFISGNAVKTLLQSPNTDQLVAHSVRSIVNFIKSEINMKPIEVFYNWKGSLVEYACDILRTCSNGNIDCRELLLNFILYLLEDIWCDKRLTQQRQWEMKVCIVNELLVNSEVCREILQYITDKLDYFIQCLTKKNNSVPLMAVKLSFFLNLYSCVCGSIMKVLKSKQTSEPNNGYMNYGETDVTTLWQEKWCSKNGNGGDENLMTRVGDSEILMLERFVIHVTTKYPLMSILAIEALKRAKDFRSFESSQNMTAYS